MTSLHFSWVITLMAKHLTLESLYMREICHNVVDNWVPTTIYNMGHYRYMLIEPK